MNNSATTVNAIINADSVNFADDGQNEIETMVVMVVGKIEAAAADEPIVLNGERVMNVVKEGI